VQVGSDNKRTSAITEILKGESGWVALAMDGKVGDPKTQHRRVWAQLISHGFDLSLGALTPSSPASVLAPVHTSKHEARSMAATAVPLTPSVTDLATIPEQ